MYDVDLCDADLLRHRGEVARAIRNRRWEPHVNGILLPDMHAVAGITCTHSVNGRGVRVDRNLMPTEGRNWALSVLVKNSTPIATWYGALFEGDYTPAAGLTASTFTASTTEYTDYDESTRVAVTFGSVSSGSVNNTGNESVFTIASGVSDDTLYGIGFLSASAKSATTGTLLSVLRFSSERVVNATDTLNIGLTLSLTSS
ncbi:MAG: hypothetical protein KDA57_16150 [Planctomycetales bacterium]|nr:hypothetical protein [Planctomycetales bacterium]